MDIESKRYRIRSTVGGYWITDKRSGNVEHVDTMPSASHLAAISEAAFDLICADKIAEARP